tara:strand:- start:90 stop:482 length:393 start_codon:yes stop_codon:yes gene_type:complete
MVMVNTTKVGGYEQTVTSNVQIARAATRSGLIAKTSQNTSSIERQSWIFRSPMDATVVRGTTTLGSCSRKDCDATERGDSGDSYEDQERGLERLFTMTFVNEALWKRVWNWMKPLVLAGVAFWLAMGVLH